LNTKSVLKAILPTMAAAGLTAVAVPTPASASGADGYWTPARMKAATPLDRSAPTPRTKALAYSIPTAHRFPGTPTVGVLFVTDRRTGDHFCTASVIDGGHRNLLITAAHCLYGSGYRSHVAFVPMYDQGRAPYGIWTAKRLTVTSGWRNSHDQDLDFGFIALNTRGGREIADVTGNNTLTINKGFYNHVIVAGYPTAANSPADQAIWCANSTSQQARYQTRFDCAGYYGGTSGSPFLLNYNHARHRGQVIGVIGGYQEGGNVDYISYSSYFDHDVWNLRASAAASS
jgi:V8-like Glu-specific endopeptidase